MDLVQRGVQRRGVRFGSAGEKRAVDVEQQQRRDWLGGSQRWNEVSGSSAPANAAISRAAASTSASDTISTGECMYRLGTDTSPVGTPARLKWIASASVPVPLPSDSTVNSIPSLSPASYRRSN